MTSYNKYPKSPEKIKASWDLTRLLSDNEDPKQYSEQKEITKTILEFSKKWESKKDYLEDPKVLKVALDEYQKIWAEKGTGGDSGYFFGLKSALDQTNPELKAKNNHYSDFERKLGNDLEFFTHRISLVSQKKQAEFLESPLLYEYKHFLEGLFKESRYLLGEEAEKIMNLKSVTSRVNWIKLTSDFLSREERIILTEDGKKEKKSFAEIVSLLDNKNKEVRDYAAKSFNSILKNNVDLAEAEINSVLQDKKINDDLRKIERPDLTRHLSDDISTEIVDTLIDIVSGRFEISRKFYEKKAKLFGLKKLKYHERNLEFGNLGKKKYSFEEAINLVEKTFAKLDPEFSDIFNSFLKNGQIDFYPGKGKEDGAFCTHYLKSQPTYVLLNFTGKLTDITTIAHEMGHAINNELMRKKQNSLNFGVPTSTAEVASTFMEDFIFDALAENLDKEEALALTMQRLNDDISSIMRQVACYKFEWDLHKNFREKGYLSKDEIGKLFSKNMGAYMGKYVEMSEGSENWWVYWSHIRSFFYVYSYASGSLISKSLQNSVKNDSTFILKVKEFLSAGSSDSPQNIFKNLGIDITDRSFWNKGLDEIENLVNLL